MTVKCPNFGHTTITIYIIVTTKLKKVMLPVDTFVMYVKPAPFTRGVCRFTYSKQSRKPFVTTTLYPKMGRGIRYNLFE